MKERQRAMAMPEPVTASRHLVVDMEYERSFSFYQNLTKAPGYNGPRYTKAFYNLLKCRQNLKILLSFLVANCTYITCRSFAVCHFETLQAADIDDAWLQRREKYKFPVTIQFHFLRRSLHFLCFDVKADAVPADRGPHSKEGPIVSIASLICRRFSRKLGA